MSPEKTMQGARAEFLLRASGVNPGGDPFWDTLREGVGRLAGSKATRERDLLRREMSVSGVAGGIQPLFKFDEERFFSDAESAHRSGEKQSLMDPATWVSGVVESGDSQTLTGTAFFLNRADVAKVSFPKSALASEESIKALEGWQRTVAELTRAQAKLAVAKEYILNTPGLDIYRSGPLGQIERAMKLTEQASLDLMAGKYGDEYISADQLVKMVAERKWKKIAGGTLYGTLAAAMVACGTGMGVAPQPTPDKLPASPAIIEATPTFSVNAVPDASLFPPQVDWLVMINPEDPLYANHGADQVAEYVDKAVVEDWGGLAGDPTYYEVYQDMAGDVEWGAGMMAILPVDIGGTQISVLVLGADQYGEPTYLGRGPGIRYHQLVVAPDRPGVVQRIELGRNGAVAEDIYQVDANGVIIAFKPIGEDWSTTGPAIGGKVQAALAPNADWMMYGAPYGEPFGGTMVSPEGQILDANGNPIIRETPPATEVIDPLAWQATADGKIMWQGAGLELFGRDQFTVNEELSGKLYKEVFLKMVYAVNRAGDTDGFAKQYAAFVSFAKYVAEHPGATYNGLLRLDQHPDSTPGNLKAYGEWLSAGTDISLDNFVVRVVDRQTGLDEDFIEIDGRVGFLMDTVEVDGKTVFRFSFTNLREGDRPEYALTDLSADNDPAENLRTLTMALNLFEALAEKKSMTPLTRESGLILTGKEPDAMDLTQPIANIDRVFDIHEAFANGDQYLLLVGREMSAADEWDMRLALYHLSNWMAYGLMGSTSKRG